MVRIPAKADSIPGGSRTGFRPVPNSSRSAAKSPPRSAFDSMLSNLTTSSSGRQRDSRQGGDQEDATCLLKQDSLAGLPDVPRWSPKHVLSSLDYRPRGRRGGYREAAQGAWIGRVRDRTDRKSV